METLLVTALARPYVVVFLVAFLTIATLNRGPRRAGLLLVIGYTVAFVSEFASIRWGIPYGRYEYLYDAMPGELIVAGVPAWDSVSYAFLAYAGYETASWLGWKRNVLGGALLMTLADVVIDPLTLHGDRWFLGQVYRYADHGLYFGVPLSNFAGWFVVALTILGLWELASARLVREPPPLRAPWLGPAFYYGIVGFVAAVGLWIGEAGSVVTGLALQAPVLWRAGRRLGIASWDLRAVFRKHVALPGDHGSWVFLLGPLLIGLVAGGRFTPASAWLIAGALAAFLVRQPLTLAVKVASGRRGRQDLAAARLWIAAYVAFGLGSAVALVNGGFGYVFWLAIPAVPVLGWFLFLVARRDERRQLLLELLATATLALAAPAAMWVGLERPDPRGWLLWALVAIQSAASIVFAYLRLAQREWKTRRSRGQEIRAAAPALSLATANFAIVVTCGFAGLVPLALAASYAFRLLEVVEGSLVPAVGWKPKRIGFRLLWGAVIATALFVLAWD